MNNNNSNENTKPKHLISELGVLKCFSIGKRVSADKIKQYKDAMEKSSKSKKETELLLDDILKKEIGNEKNFSSIPGMIVDKPTVERQEYEKYLVEITYLASMLSKRIVDRNLKKMDKCYLIHVLVNMLNLNEEDFDQFHRSFEKFKAGECDSLEDDGLSSI